MTDLDNLRAELDAADARILDALDRRFEVIRRIARHKKSQGLPMMQPARVAFVRDRYESFGVAHGVPAGALGRVAAELVDAACRLEDDLIAGRSGE